MDEYTNASTVEIIVYQSHSWTLSRFNCDQTIINTLGPYLDNGVVTGQPNVACQSAAASCTAAGWVLINNPTFCTDFSLAVLISSGALIRKQILSRNTAILVGFTGIAWATQIRTTNGTPANPWSVMTRIDLTQKYPINFSPGIFSHFTIFHPI